jgi:hypothetical protein
LTDVVYPFFDSKRMALVSKLEELLRHYKYGIPQPLEPEFRAKMEHRYSKRQLVQGRALLDKAQGRVMDEHRLAAMLDDVSGGRRQNWFNSEDVLEKMMIYYEVSTC